MSKRNTQERSSNAPVHTQILVIGSGAGGALTAATLSARGYEVVLLEDGPDIDTARVTSNSPEAIARLYRNGGLTPILGNQTIAYVEGRCLGGSTEVNSAFWHRLPPDCYHRWRTDALLADFSPKIMDPYFETLEQELSVSYLNTDELPKSSELFRKGIERLGWEYVEVPRCQKDNAGGNPFAPGKKQSMQRTYIPKAVRAGTRIIANCKAVRVLHENGHATGAQALLTDRHSVARSFRSTPTPPLSAVERSKHRRCCAAAASRRTSATTSAFTQ